MAKEDEFAVAQYIYAFGSEQLDDETRRRYTETVLDTLMNGYLAK
ncbi:hypothetical protein [Parvibaculum sp.]|nr:hypothetical protein [Parvibaculum sp.]MBX3490141.1 hypothetical protein [Parvibaculum sp.]MCW5725871.1 hypothetical protein [Parvibaculum sp.]